MRKHQSLSFVQPQGGQTPSEGGGGDAEWESVSRLCNSVSVMTFLRLQLFSLSSRECEMDSRRTKRDNHSLRLFLQCKTSPRDQSDISRSQFPTQRPQTPSPTQTLPTQDSLRGVQLFYWTMVGERFMRSVETGLGFLNHRPCLG